MPEGTLQLPVFYDTLRTLDQTVEVDYYLPGCPPEAERISELLEAILEGKLPPKRGTVIGAQTTVCDECTRTRHEKKIKEIHRTWQMLPDHETVPAGAGARVLRHRHPRRLRRAVPAGQLALHRLLRRERRRRATSARA